MATTTSSSEIDIITDTAAPGDLITSELMQTIINTINELVQAVGGMQEPPVPQTGKPPVILNVLSGGMRTESMTVDPGNPPTIIQGTGLSSFLVVKLDSIPLPPSNVFYTPGTAATDTLTLTGLDGLLQAAAGYQSLQNPPIGLLSVANTFGTATRIVRLAKGS